MDYYKRYGYCIIPKGTRLYRGGKMVKDEQVTFFALQQYIAQVFRKESDSIQIWTTQKEIKVLFMVEDLSIRSWVKSSISDIYYDVDSSIDILDDIEIKRDDLQKREALVQHLHSKNIIGWLYSLENKVDLEVCLFPKNDRLEKLIKLEEEYEFNDRYVLPNALEKIEVYPSPAFFTKVKTSLAERTFERHQELTKDWMEDEIKRGLTPELARHYYLDMRMKLEI